MLGLYHGKRLTNKLNDLFNENKIKNNIPNDDRLLYLLKKLYCFHYAN